MGFRLLAVLTSWSYQGAYHGPIKVLTWSPKVSKTKAQSLWTQPRMPLVCILLGSRYIGSLEFLKRRPENERRYTGSRASEKWRHWQPPNPRPPVARDLKASIRWSMQAGVAAFLWISVSTHGSQTCWPCLLDVEAFREQGRCCQRWPAQSCANSGLHPAGSCHALLATKIFAPL